MTAGLFLDPSEPEPRRALEAGVTEHLIAGLAAASAMAVVCLRPPPGARPVRELVDDLVSGGTAWLSVASFEGREVLRLCVTNGRTTPEDIDHIAAAILALA